MLSIPRCFTISSCR